MGIAPSWPSLHRLKLSVIPTNQTNLTWRKRQFDRAADPDDESAETTEPLESASPPGFLSSNESCSQALTVSGT